MPVVDVNTEEPGCDGMLQVTVADTVAVSVTLENLENILTTTGTSYASHVP